MKFAMVVPRYRLGMPAERRAPKARHPVERFTCIVPRGRIRRAWSGARGPMLQARAKKVRCPCDKSMTSLQQNNDTRATKLRFCGSISPHGLIRTNPNRGFICHRSNAISRKWTLTAFFSRRISNSLSLDPPAIYSRGQSAPSNASSDTRFPVVATFERHVAL